MKAAIELICTVAVVGRAKGCGECSSRWAIVDGVGERASDRMCGTDVMMMIDGILLRYVRAERVADAKDRR